LNTIVKDIGTSITNTGVEGPIKDDIGWSCSIKSVQMLLAYYFKKWGIETYILNLLYKESGSLSVHSFIRKCIQCKCKEQTGDYFGVYTVLGIYRTLLHEHNIFTRQDTVHMTTDNIIDIDALNWNEQTILIYSTRLGIHKLDPFYKEMILNLFKCPHFDGILGGVGKSCYYFIARHIHLENLIYLDPHFISDYNEDTALEDLRGTNYISTHIDNLNPSLTFCFSYQTHKEFMELKMFLEKNTIFNILHKKYVEIPKPAIIDQDIEWEVF